MLLPSGLGRAGQGSAARLGLDAAARHREVDWGVQHYTIKTVQYCAAWAGAREVHSRKRQGRAVYHGSLGENYTHYKTKQQKRWMSRVQVHDCRVAAYVCVSKKEEEAGQGSIAQHAQARA